jgi:hypothetical protein
MAVRHFAFMLLAVTSLFSTPQLAFAEDAISSPAQKTIGASKTAMVPSLAVLNSRSATLQGNKLTMNGVSANSIIFADRPVRAAGHVLTSDFIKQWDVGNNSFSQDPPNATISVLGSDGASVKDAVVVLKTPKLEGDQLTFDVSVLEGDLRTPLAPLRSLSTGSRLAAALAEWALWEALVSTPQCGMAPTTVIQGLHSRQALPSLPWEPLQHGRITMRLQPAGIIPIHLATKSQSICTTRPRRTAGSS